MFLLLTPAPSGRRFSRSVPTLLLSMDPNRSCLHVQDYLSAGLSSVVSETSEINAQLESRAKTLRSLFSTKDVLPENQEVKNTNAHMLAARYYRASVLTSPGAASS